jgi:hypothetical protein
VLVPGNVNDTITGGLRIIKCIFGTFGDSYLPISTVKHKAKLGQDCPIVTLTHKIKESWHA